MFQLLVILIVILSFIKFSHSGIYLPTAISSGIELIF